MLGDTGTDGIGAFITNYGPALAAFGAVLTLIVGMITVMIELVRLGQNFQQECRAEEQEARSKYNLAMEERRLGEANVVTDF